MVYINAYVLPTTLIKSYPNTSVPGCVTQLGDSTKNEAGPGLWLPAPPWGRPCAHFLYRKSQIHHDGGTKLRCVIINHYQPRDMFIFTQIYFFAFMLELENTVLKEFFCTASSKLCSLPGFALISVTVELGVCLRVYICWSLVVKNMGSWLQIVRVYFCSTMCQLCVLGHFFHLLVPSGHSSPSLLRLQQVINEMFSSMSGKCPIQYK